LSIVVGIDEAGYGPTLGPLVVSAVAFRVPDEHRDADLWKLLGGYVSGNVRVRQKLIVADSKESYTRSKGVGVLEETTLCFLALSGKRFERMDELLTALAGVDANDALSYPWYRPAEHAVPVSGRALGIDEKSDRLRRTLSDAGVEFLGARSLPLFEAAFNRSVDETGNKQTVLFAQAARLMGGMMKRFGGEDLMIHVDKQGGRDRYGPLLARRFKGVSLTVKQQDREVGHYRLRRKGSSCEVRFMMHGEKHSMAVALASMYSKYVRELYMQLFNAFWKTHLSDVKPTAGYATDAKRFLAEIAPARERLGIPDDVLIRKK
jgi:hypothetical protein